MSFKNKSAWLENFQWIITLSRFGSQGELAVFYLPGVFYDNAYWCVLYTEKGLYDYTACSKNRTKGTLPKKKNVFFRALPKLPLSPPLPPIRASCTTFFGRQKRRLARITEPSNDDYDNDVSDNCDHNFGTFDDFGVKNDQKVYT